MHFKYHILLSLLFTPFILTNKLIIISMITSILIDLDHYKFIKYSIKNKTFKTKQFYNKYKQKATYFRIFHSPYFLVLLLSLLTITNNLYIFKIQISQIILFTIIGLIYHIIFDIIEIFIFKKQQNYKTKFLKKFVGIKITKKNANQN